MGKPGEENLLCILFYHIDQSAKIDPWTSQTGPYQYYIHGNESIQQYIELSDDFKNSADETSSQGVKFTLDNSAYWNRQNMRRIELIPQTSAKINEGKVRERMRTPSTFRHQAKSLIEN